MRTPDPRFEPGTLNAYHIRPDEIRSGDRYGYKIIVRVSAFDWCAYRGPTGWTDKQVQEQGDAIQYDAAIKLFPVFVDTELVYGD